jgi:SAM-dependent methyltransferase
LQGEQHRMKLMSELLDPLELTYVARVGVGPGWRCLELGCGNGSVSQALADRVAPNGRVVASDIDISYVEKLQAPCLEVRRIDILNDAVEAGGYEFVVARALLHHLGRTGHQALQRMVTAVKPGGVLLSIETDMLPCTVAEPDSMRAFWQAWVKWSVEAGIDFFVARKIPAWLDEMGLEGICGEGHVALFNGGSPWADYWIETVNMLTPKLLKSGHFTDKLIEEFHVRYRDPHYWTSVISFTANWGRKPG